MIAKSRTLLLALHKDIFRQTLESLERIMARDEDESRALMLIGVPLFTELSADLRKKVQDHLHAEEFEDGVDLFTEG